MILYRIQTGHSGTWANEWHPTQADAFAAFDKIVTDLGDLADIHLDEVEVSTTKTKSCSGRENLAAALTNAHVNRAVWPGDKELKRHNAPPHPTDLKELLS